jgi:hypothetical protein
MIRTLFAVFLFAATAFAQVVHVANNSAAPFVGWKRYKVDTRPPHAAGTIGTTRFVLGRRTGLDTWAVDLHLELAAGERRAIDLAASSAAAPPPVTLPPLDYFGGWLAVGGVPLQLVELAADGAALTVRLQGRVSPMLHADVWARWYPDEPTTVVGEAVITCSNGSIPDMAATAPPGGLALTFGDGMVGVPGAGWGAPLVPGGTRFVDGQARGVPFAIGWPRHIFGSADETQAWVRLAAAVGLTTCGHGIAQLLPHGTPSDPPGFDPIAWTRNLFPEALRRLHTWENGVVGANASSGDTGAQEDQVFVRGESFHAGGEGAELVAYLSALEWLSRPSHHLEASGRQADPAEHPHCVFWSGRPHWHTGVSPDQLGKPGPLPDPDYGWTAQDREHWLIGTLAAGARLVESPALQWELQQHARAFLFGETVRPGYSTSGADAARSVGWAGIVAVQLWRELEDRALAERVRARYLERVSMVYVPQLGTKPFDVWDVRDDVRLGPGLRWMAWQQSIGAYGLWLAGDVFGIEAARSLALRAALACIDHNWILQQGRYHGVGNIEFPPPPPSAYDGRAWPDPWFETTWDVPAVFVVLREQPGHTKARAIWQQIMGDLGNGRRSWVPPGPIPPPPPPPDTTPRVLSVSQWGISWTFAAPAPAGQFVNGDWWVVGPVTVTSIEPPTATIGGGRIVNGSMLNPPMTGAHGYDSALYGQYSADQRVYVPALNVAAALPLEITGRSSLVSTISQVGPHPSGSPSEIKTAAVLTVLDAVPPADAFRPPYTGPKDLFRLSQVDTARLAHLAPAPGAPSMTATAAAFERVWLDHCPHWTSGRMHPADNMPSYYRDFTTLTGDAGLLLNCDYTDAAKRPLLIRFLQVGIDWWGCNEVGQPWGVNGHCNGRKFPILFAGRMLDEPRMLGIAKPVQFFGPDHPLNVPVWWSEDGQTFYVAETSPGVFNWGFGGYTAADVGLPEWGNFHANGSQHDIAADSRDWLANNYRRCCSANAWPGVTLTMRTMGLVDAWGHQPFFDYMDRYMAAPFSDAWHRSWSTWQGAMWDAHQ